MDTPLLTLLSPTEVGKSLADRAKALRLLKGWTRDTLAGRAGISPDRRASCRERV